MFSNPGSRLSTWATGTAAVPGLRPVTLSAGEGSGNAIPLLDRPGAVNASRHPSETWRGTRSRQPPSSKAFTLSIQRRTWERIQPSECHLAATSAGP